MDIPHDTYYFENIFVIFHQKYMNISYNKH